MRYKIGNRVRIRSDLQEDVVYGGDKFVVGMYSLIRAIK